MAFDATSKLGDNVMLRGLFYDEYQALQEEPWVPGIAGEIQDSSKGMEEYGFLSQMPGLQLFLGKLNATSPTLNSLMILNEDFEASVNIPDKELRRDSTGQLRKYMGTLAETGPLKWQEMVSDLILAGHAVNGFDEVPFFSAAHPCGDPNGNTYTNLLTASDCPFLNVGTPTAPEPLELAKAVLQVIQKFKSMKGEAGRSFNRNAKEFAVMCGTALAAPMMMAVTAPTLETGTGATVANPLKYSQYEVSLVENSDLDGWTTSFAAFRLDSRFGPLLRQEEMKIKIETLGEGSDHKVKTGNHLVSAKAARGMGYQAPWTAAKATLS